MTRCLFLALVVALSACTTVVEEGPGSRKANPEAGARDRVAIAAEHLRSGDNEKAQIQLRKALEMNPHSAEAHSMMGVLLDRDGDIKGADKEFRKAISERSDYSQAHNNYAIFLFRNGRYKEAMKHFAAVTDDLGYDYRAQAYEGVGRCALLLNKPEEAATAFTKALKLDSTLSVSTLEIGELQYKQGNYDAARSAYQRYLELTKGVPQTAQSLWLGIRLGRRGTDRNALASYELALKKLYPDSPEYKLYTESLKAGK